MKVIIFLILIVLLVIYVFVAINSIKDLVIYFKEKKEKSKIENEKKGE